MARSAALRGYGVPTPQARPAEAPNAVEFDLLEGVTGMPLAWIDLESLLEPVTRLHASRVPGLKVFDPFLRIRPRIALATSPLVRAVLDEPIPEGSSTLHGDLHVGQFIQDRFGRVCIVDLDDLALGPPEADLANFAAHLATSTAGSIGHWSNRVRDAWGRLGNSCDERIFQSYLRFALVRRHLKLREAGRPNFEGAVLAYLRESSNFSIR